MLAESGLVFGCFEYHILQPGAPDRLFFPAKWGLGFRAKFGRPDRIQGVSDLGFPIFLFSGKRCNSNHLKSSDFLCSNHHFSQEIQWLAPKIKAPEIRGSQVFSYIHALLYPCSRLWCWEPVKLCKPGDQVPTWNALEVHQSTPDVLSKTTIVSAWYHLVSLNKSHGRHRCHFATKLLLLQGQSLLNKSWRIVPWFSSTVYFWRPFRETTYKKLRLYFSSGRMDPSWSKSVNPCANYCRFFIGL